MENPIKMDDLEIPLFQETSKSQKAQESWLVGGLEHVSPHILGMSSSQPPPSRAPVDRQVYDDVWGSSERAPSYTALRRQANSCDWLLRSLEPLPGGSVVIRRHTAAVFLEWTWAGWE